MKIQMLWGGVFGEFSQKEMDKLKITAPELSALRVWRAEQICYTHYLEFPIMHNPSQII
jgi:hypothetical protein